ncbi:ATP-binding protein, partial [Vibrio splendidus]|uniref:ATP-binding protein n=1 Tax=Vibrio splendidus TaxID=29497 RepID=UPI0018E432B0
MANTNQTIKKLSEFKDAAKFERLATAYLRASNPNKYQDTSHLGVNPKGSTVKAPLDGFATYEENGELGIAGLEHTTTEINKLHDKFLKDLSTVKPKDPKKGATGTEGDLRKSIDVINTYRTQYPDIKRATVALVSTLDPKPNTILDAKALAKSNNIDLEIHGGTRIADYLDTTAKGQYLRKLYLGENPDKLSLELLRDITEKQIEEYSKFIDTQLIAQRTHNQFEVSHHKFLVGESGVGKSIIASELLKTNFENGSAGIFLSEKFVAELNSLEEAITRQLALFESTLDNDAGAMALELCPTHLPFVIVIEDVNNSDNPIKLLQKILKWIPKEHLIKWRLVCPVYPTYIDSLKHDEKERINEFTEYVGNYSTKEAVEAIKLKVAKSGFERLCCV